MKDYHFKLDYDLVIRSEDEDEARERLQNELDNMSFEEQQIFLDSDQWEVNKTTNSDDK